MQAIRVIAYAAIGLMGLAAAQPLRPAFVVGHSMSPTYASGELVWMRPVDRPLRRGDVVVADTPGGSVIKRIAFLPGDIRTQFYSGSEWTDMTLLGGPRHQKHTSRMRKILVPAGQVYLLGDNLSTSVDSRIYGTVRMDRIRGIVQDARNPAASAGVLAELPQRWLSAGLCTDRGSLRA